MLNHLSRYLDSYQEEESYFVHDGHTYDLNPVLVLVEDRDPVEVDMADLVWNIEDIEYDDERVEKADLSFPLIVLDSDEYGIVVLDGTHRLIKAYTLDYKALACCFVTESEIKAFRVD